MYVNAGPQAVPTCPSDKSLNEAKLVKVILKTRPHLEETRHFTITKINWFMLFNENIALYSENRTKHISKTMKSYRLLKQVVLILTIDLEEDEYAKMQMIFIKGLRECTGTVDQSLDSSYYGLLF